MTDKERREAYEKYREELLKRQLSNDEAYDKAILSLSSAGLAITLTLYDKILPEEGAELLCLLYASWIFFALAIISTIASFQISQKGLSIQETIAEKYYIDKDEQAFDEKNWAANLTSKINIISGVAFILAILSFVSLGIFNFNQQQYANDGVVETMSDKKSKSVVIEKGASIPKMQRVNTGKEQLGATIPKPSTTKSVKKDTTPKKE
jgi:hypothetical protein